MFSSLKLFYKNKNMHFTDEKGIFTVHVEHHEYKTILNTPQNIKKSEKQTLNDVYLMLA